MIFVKDRYPFRQSATAQRGFNNYSLVYMMPKWSVMV